MESSAGFNKNTIDIGNKVHEILTTEICGEVGLIPIMVNDKKICLGAMNPSYKKVKLIEKKISATFGIPVEVKQISTSDWEKWFEDGNTDIKINKTNNILGEIKKQSKGNLFSKTIIKEHEQHDNNLGKYSSGNNQLDGDILTDRELKKPEGELEDQIEAMKEFEALEDQSSLEESSSYLRNDDDDKVSYLDQIDNDSTIEEDKNLIDEEDLCNSDDPLIAGVASILNKCFVLKASDIHAEPLEEKLRIRFRIDGILKEFYSLNKSLANPVISRLKIMGRLDIAEKRLPQDGRIRCLLDGKIRDFRVSTLPGKWGEKVVLRALESDTSVLDLNKLINSKNALKIVRGMGHSPYGIVIVVGPTGSGKSTTLYSILNELNTDEVNISTVEDPVEYTLQGIHQVQVIREKGLDFAKALRSLMRQDPDIILVGETRDKETAQTAMEAALTGHMVFTTLHANDTATAITRLSEMGIPSYLIGSSVIGVIAQRLVRRVCPKCSTRRNLDEAKDKLAMSFGISHARSPRILVGGGKQSTDQNACKNCGGSGYKGRLGIYEIMKINDNLRELIMSGSTADVLRNKAYEVGVKSLLEYGMDLVREELTTIEEVERVCLLESE